MKSKKGKKVEKNKSAKIIKLYAEASKKLYHYPTWEELKKEVGLTRSGIRHYYDSLEELKTKAKELYPEHFEKVIDLGLYNPKRFAELSNKLKKYKRFFVTTVDTTSEIHDGALASVRRYCENKNAALLLIPANNDISEASSEFLSKLSDENIIFDELALNKSLHLSTIKIQPKMIKPTTGLERIGQRDGSFIFASPKQNLKNVAVAGRGLPHVLMTTGAITLPKYNGQNYIQWRTDYIANHDHVMGGIVVELEDDDIHFHFRQVQFEKDGSFVDLGEYYRPNGNIESLKPAALVLGDWHSGETDPSTFTFTKDIADLLNPDKVIIHDAFDGKSVNPHERHNILNRGILASEQKLSLRAELVGLANDLNWLGTLFPEVIVAESNHDLFLTRYLSDKDWVNDSHNFEICLDIAHAIVHRNQKHPLKYSLEVNGLTATNIRFLKEDESFQVANIELGAHGHRGNNGAKGTLAQMELAYGQSVTAHAHTPEILRGAWQVGTGSILNPAYAKGASSWMHTHCLVFPNGARQLINVINGKWRKI